MRSATAKSQFHKRAVEKAIAFSLKHPNSQDNRQIHLGVPLGSATKILGPTTIHSSGKTEVGIIHESDRAIAALDFYREIFQTPILAANYVVIVSSSSGELMALPLIEEPVLIELVKENIRLLPDRYRQVDLLGCADRVAIIDTETETQTIFLLDPNRLVAVGKQRSLQFVS